MRHGARPRDSMRDPVIQARYRRQPAAVPYAPGPVFCLPDWGSTLARMHRLARRCLPCAAIGLASCSPGCHHPSAMRHTVRPGSHWLGSARLASRICVITGSTSADPRVRVWSLILMLSQASARRLAMSTDHLR
jgi:hypothetical protein